MKLLPKSHPFLRVSPLFIVHFLLCCLVSFPALLTAQIIQDAQGNVPAIRHPKGISPPKENAWQEFQKGHLFNFSDSINSIVVDPVIQAHWGKTQGLESESVWDNIRGARFQARIDGIWHIGGELLERQGVASPMLGHWAAQQRIPGWGRSKLGRDNGFNTADNAYYDVARARGWFGWSNDLWFVDGGIDALHIGAGKNSAFLSLEAAPSPYMRVARKAGKHRSAMWLTHWIDTERGPVGETAESLLNRSRVLFAMHSWQLDPRLLVQAVYSFVRENEASDAMGEWSGWDEGEQYHARRHWGGMELQFTSPANTSTPWLLYVQSAFDFIPRKGQSNSTTRFSNALTYVTGARLKSNSLAVQIEYSKQETAHCRDCFGSYPDAGPFETMAPGRALLQNAGISVQSLWTESIFLNTVWNPLEQLTLKVYTEVNTQFSWVTPEIAWEVHSVWPLDIFTAHTTGIPRGVSEKVAFRFWQVGVRSCLPSL